MNDGIYKTLVEKAIMDTGKSVVKKVTKTAVAQKGISLPKVKTPETQKIPK